MRRKLVDHGAAWVTESEKLGYLVEGLARRVVASPAQQAIDENLPHFITDAYDRRSLPTPAREGQSHSG